MYAKNKIKPQKVSIKTVYFKKLYLNKLTSDFNWNGFVLKFRERMQLKLVVAESTIYILFTCKVFNTVCNGAR